MSISTTTDAGPLVRVTFMPLTQAWIAYRTDGGGTLTLHAAADAPGAALDEAATAWGVTVDQVEVLPA